LNPALRTLRLSLYDALATADLRPIDVAKAMTSGIDELGGDTNEQRRNAGWLIRFAQEFYRQVVLQLSGNDAPAGPGSDVVSRFASILTRRGAKGIELSIGACSPKITSAGTSPRQRRWILFSMTWPERRGRDSVLLGSADQVRNTKERVQNNFRILTTETQSLAGDFSLCLRASVVRFF
jgi:hypothetical protein